MTLLTRGLGAVAKNFIQRIKKTPNKTFADPSFNVSGKIQKKKIIKEQKSKAQKYKEKGDTYKAPMRFGVK
tara:strand:- start:310 stop:522 length:213 start_codon:yes stop_codon:yes gene_type:complete